MAEETRLSDSSALQQHHSGADDGATTGTVLVDQFLDALSPSTTPVDEVKYFRETKEFLKAFVSQEMNPGRGDVLRDYEEAQVILVDGDSILLEMLSNEKLDWSHGGQFLHLTYLVESFLKALQDCGALLNIVVFTATKSIWSSCPSGLLARSAFISHLKFNTSIPVHDTFGDWWDPKWKEFVLQKKPVFMLMSSGGINAPWISRETLIQMSPISELGGWSECCDTLLYSLLLVSLSLEVNCVFIGDLQTEVNRTTANRVYYNYQKNQEILKCNSLVRRGIDYLFKIFKSASLVRDFQLQPPTSLIDAAISNSILRSGGWRLICATVATVCCLVEKGHNCYDLDILRLFLIHILLLERLPIDIRPQTLPLNEDDIVVQSAHVRALKKLLPRLQSFLCQALESIQPYTFRAGHSAKDSLPSCYGIADMMDGRLAYSVIYHFVTKSRQLLAGMFGHLDENDCLSSNSWPSNFMEIWTVAQSLASETTVPAFSIEAATITPSPMLPECRWPCQLSDDQGGYTLLQVNSPLIESTARELHASLLHSEVEDAAAFTTESFPSSDFEEKFHWHSFRLLGEEFFAYHKTAWGKKDKRELKLQQRYTKFVHDYAVSLEGNIHTEPMMVKRTGTEAADAESKGKKPKSRVKAGGKSKVAKKAQIIIEQNEQRKREQQLMKKAEQLKNVQMCVGGPGKATLGGISELYKFIDTCTLPEKRLAARNFVLKICKYEWERTESSAWGAHLFSVVHDIARDHRDEVVANSKLKSRLLKSLRSMGFEQNACLLEQQVLRRTSSILKNSIPSDDEIDALHSSIDRQEKGVPAQRSCARFQLEYMGHLMKLKEPLNADPRVSHFVPDQWQRDLMDCIDRDQSVIVSAPTSSGKTFVSYYCIRKVLERSDDDMVVYVSPTQALVNQVTATIYGRFGHKTCPPGRTVCGACTRDYWQNVDSCQVLVTVPRMLEVLLMAPSRQEAPYASRLKYVIFDEIHCLGSRGQDGDSNGEVWERLLLLIRCPFLALSATIGNPENLRAWLDVVVETRRQQDGGRKTNVQLIVYGERSSQLDKFVYNPASSEAEESLLTLHPCAVLNMQQLISVGFPQDFRLSAKETLQLYDAMNKVANETGNLACIERLQRLEPDRAFESCLIISRRELRVYETAIKEELEHWARERMSAEVDGVLNSIRRGSAIDLALDSVRGDWWEDIVEDIPVMLRKLQELDKLPVIIFCFDRVGCERIVQLVTDFLESEEIRKRLAAANLESRRQIRRTEKQVEKQMKHVERDRKREDRQKRKKRSADDFGDDDAEDSRFLEFDEYDPRKCLEFGCTFVNRLMILPTLEFKLLMSKKRIGESSSWFLRGLQRGISCHHSAMGRKQRQAVEMLFRRRTIQVVVATGTLALGIHMPCRTVVFAANSPWLNELQYRQMSGRAGRRGFDRIGNVIFHGVPRSKITHLLTSDVPHIKANVTINFTIILRLLVSVSLSSNPGLAEKQAAMILNRSMLCAEKPEMTFVVQNFLLLAMEYLQRQGLINKLGSPIGLAGLITHLHYTDPANFALLSCFKQGLFRKMLADHGIEQVSKGFEWPVRVLEEIMLVICYLFNRLVIHPFTKMRHDVDADRSGSTIILPQLPASAVKAFETYNDELYSVVDTYFHAVGSRFDETQCKLPLSHTDVIRTRTHTETEIEAALRETAFKPKYLVKSFSILSAQPVSLDNALDMFRYLRKRIPVLDVNESDEQGRPRLFNSYLFDFFKHGAVKTIERWNGLPSGDIFHRLKDTSLVLKTITRVLDELCLDSDPVIDTDPVIVAFHELSVTFTAKFNKAYDIKPTEL